MNVYQSMRTVISEIHERELRQDLRVRIFGEDYDRISVPLPVKILLSELPGIKENLGKIINYGNTKYTFCVETLGAALISKAWIMAWNRP